MIDELLDELEAAGTEHDTAPGVPPMVYDNQQGEPEDWEEVWFHAPTRADKRDSWADDLDRLSRHMPPARRRRYRTTKPWPPARS